MSDEARRSDNADESVSVHSEPAWGDVVKDGEAVPPPEDRVRSANGATDDEIARRAYERYEQRGREQGLDVDDWLSAERDLRDRTSDED